MDNSIKINRLKEIKKFFSKPIMLCVIILEIIIFFMDLTFYILTHNNPSLSEYLFTIFVFVSEVIMIIGLFFIYISSKNNLSKSLNIGIIMTLVSILLSIFSVILFFVLSNNSKVVNTTSYGPLLFMLYYYFNFNILYYLIAAITIIFIKRNIAGKSLHTKIYTVFFIISIIHILLQLQIVVMVGQLGILIIRTILKTVLCIIVTTINKNYNDSFIKLKNSLNNE